MAFDFDKLKEMAKHLGGVLVMNGNEPELVILSYDRFSTMGEQPRRTGRIVGGRGADTEDLEDPESSTMIDALNKEILALKEEIRQKELTEAEVA